MIKDFIKNIFAIVVLSAVLIITCVLFVVSYYNKENAKGYAEEMIKMLEKEIVIYKDNYREFVKIGDKDTVRITIIDLDGRVLADTIRDDIESNPFENHSNRKEVIEVIEAISKKNIVYALRLSSSHDIKFLYAAKKIKVGSEDIILRVAHPLESINKYFISFIFTTIIVIAFIMIIISAILPYIVKNFIKPYSIIRENLDNILLGKTDIKKSITKFDEINVVLDEINILSNNLNINNIKRKKEQEKLSCLLENMREGIIALDKNKNILFINNIAKNFLSIYSNSNPKHLLELVRSGYFLSKIENSYNKKEYTSFDIVRDNNIIECIIFPVLSSDIDLLIKLNNVSDERKLAKEKQDFFTNASHELNTPLTSILGYSELLLNGEKDNKKEFLEKIYFEANRMKDLVNDMLLLSRTDIGYQEESLEIINLSNIVRDVIETLKVKAKNKNITILESLEECRIEADSKKIHQVVNNIISNAIKYSKENGEVRVIVNRANDKVIFKVIDNGIGIPKEHLNRVFERFFRSNNVGSISGTGLGLTIVKNICAHYNANITLKSEKDKSTEFTISFKCL